MKVAPRTQPTQTASIRDSGDRARVVVHKELLLMIKDFPAWFLDDFADLEFRLGSEDELLDDEAVERLQSPHRLSIGGCCGNRNKRSTITQRAHK